MVKKELISVLQFIEQQIGESRCTAEELTSWRDMLAKELRVEASIEEIAKQFGQSESNVRNVINRRMTEKPKRRVVYNLWSFMQVMPSTWLKNNH